MTDMGRRAHQPEPVSRRQVEAMAACGVPEADIATVIGVDPKTLRKHYRLELTTGSIKANTRVAESLYKKAIGEGPQSVTAGIFWLKTRAHWKETIVNEVQHQVGGSVKELMEWVAANGRCVHDKLIEAAPDTTNASLAVADHPARETSDESQ